MNSEMDPNAELASIIFEYTGLGPFPDQQEYGAAEAIIRAGYSKSPTR